MPKRAISEASPGDAYSCLRAKFTVVPGAAITACAMVSSSLMSYHRPGYEAGSRNGSDEWISRSCPAMREAMPHHAVSKSKRAPMASSAATASAHDGACTRSRVAVMARCLLMTGSRVKKTSWLIAANR